MLMDSYLAEKLKKVVEANPRLSVSFWHGDQWLLQDNVHRYMVWKILPFQRRLSSLLLHKLFVLHQINRNQHLDYTDKLRSIHSTLCD
jgi:hypothetical protein